MLESGGKELVDFGGTLVSAGGGGWNSWVGVRAERRVQCGLACALKRFLCTSWRFFDSL